MADYLGVSRRSVGNWIGGHVDPSAQTVRLWALKTGVPFAWLCHGDTRPCDLRPRVGAAQSRADRRTSNIMQSLAGRAVAGYGTVNGNRAGWEPWRRLPWKRQTAPSEPTSATWPSWAEASSPSTTASGP